MTLDLSVFDEKNFGSKISDPYEKLRKLLLFYGLTPNQAKVYLFVSKMGVKTASEISNNLKIPRTETYHLLNSLQQKGIIFSIFGKPTKFNAIELDKAIDILIKNEKNRISELELRKESIVQIWKNIPKHGEMEEEEQNKFQTLQGKNSILVKLEKMIKTGDDEILVLGTETDFIKFYHTEFTNHLRKCKGELKILTTYSDKGNYIFEDIPLERIKKLEDKGRENFCFIIKDDDEVIFFINNSNIDDIAIWTDSKSFVSSLKSLFKLVWKKSHYVTETNQAKLLGTDVTYEHRLREIEQEKMILNYLHNKFKLNNGGI